MVVSEKQINQETNLSHEEIIKKQAKEINYLKKMAKDHINALGNRYKEINILKDRNKRLKESIPNKQNSEKIRKLRKENNLLKNQIKNLKNHNQMIKKDRRQLRKILQQKGLINAKPVPKQVKQKVFKRDNNTCLKCWATDDLSIDHITPRFKGGNNEKNNLQVLCKTCNLEKGIKIIDYRRNEEESLVLDYYMIGFKAKSISEETGVKQYKVYKILHKFIDLGVIDDFNLKSRNNKLKREDIEKIKILIKENDKKFYNQDRLTLEQIGDMFNVSASTICLIKNNKR